MWAAAASVSDKYSCHSDILYRRARKYAEYDEMRGQGQDVVSVAHCQTWSLIAMYEFKNMFFPRAWMSVARACRLALMMGLNRMDGVGIDVKQCLTPQRIGPSAKSEDEPFGWPTVVIDLPALGQAGR